MLLQALKASAQEKGREREQVISSRRSVGKKLRLREY